MKAVENVYTNWNGEKKSMQFNYLADGNVLLWSMKGQVWEFELDSAGSD